MAKVAIENASRSNLFFVDPDDFLLSVIDYACGPEDPNYEPRNKMPVDEEMVKSVMALGVFSPVEVIKREDGKLIPVFGNQRIRAAREANKRFAAAGKKDRVKVPTKTPLKGSDANDRLAISVAENERRQDSTALVKAERAAHVLRHNGGNINEAARIFGLSGPKFRALLSLREASGELKAALRDNRISASAAMDLASLPKEAQVERLTRVISRGGSVEVARNEVKKAKGRADRSRPGIPLIKELLAFNKPGSDLWKSIGAIDAFRWFIGDIPASKLPGLKAAIDKLSNDENEAA